MAIRPYRPLTEAKQTPPSHRMKQMVRPPTSPGCAEKRFRRGMTDIMIVVFYFQTVFLIRFITALSSHFLGKARNLSVVVKKLEWSVSKPFFTISL